MMWKVAFAAAAGLLALAPAIAVKGLGDAEVAHVAYTAGVIDVAAGKQGCGFPRTTDCRRNLCGGAAVEPGATLLWPSIVALIAAPVALAATGTQQRPAATYTIAIDKMAFGAPPRGLRVGDAIIWIN